MVEARLLEWCTSLASAEFRERVPLRSRSWASCRLPLYSVVNVRCEHDARWPVLELGAKNPTQQLSGSFRNLPQTTPDGGLLWPWSPLRGNRSEDSFVIGQIGLPNDY